MAPPKKDSKLVLHETDETENQTAIFIYSEPSDQSKQSPARVDISPTFKPPSSWSKDGLISLLCDVFLPSGFPDSVTADYVPYQVFDSLQAFCSSIAGLLSSRAVLQGVGVGNAEASPTNALLLHILQDTSGRIATILFAHRVGTALEPECKTYRLAADVFNDIAMIMDCLSPMVPAGIMRVSVLSTAGVLRALCGVAGGSSKASLSAHFAKWGNLAELNAKDSSQETIISLFGMLVGSVVVSHITGFKTTWIALILLLASHLSLNYAAVRSVQMTSLNRQRASMVFSNLIENDHDIYTAKKSTQPSKTNTTHQFPTPAQIASKERILQKGTPFFWSNLSSTSRLPLGTAEIGVSLTDFFANTYPKTPNTHPQRSFKTTLPLKPLTEIFNQESYILNLTPTPNKKQWHVKILLKPTAKVTTTLKAWCHALITARLLCEYDYDLSTTGTTHTPVSVSVSQDIVLEYISETLEKLNHDGRFEGYLDGLRGVGWDVDVGALEVKAGRRVFVE